MINVIHKFQFNLAKAPDNREWDVSLPAGAKIIAFQMQGNFPTMWYSSAISGVLVINPHRFKLAMTGEEFSSPVQYGGTVQTSSGIVLHLVELLLS